MSDEKVQGINGIELPMTMQAYEENQFISKKDWHLKQIEAGHTDDFDEEHFEMLKKFFGITDAEIKSARLARDLSKVVHGA
jgi:hypothetical protein